MPDQPSQVDPDAFEPLTDAELERTKLPELREAYRLLRARHGGLISASLQDLKSQGRYTGGKPPYGFRISEDGTTLEPHPDEQRAIAIARQLRAGGLSYLGIAKTLAEQEIRSREGGMFYSAQVKAMIHGGRKPPPIAPSLDRPARRAR